ncbi:MAG: hypothetical protein U0610_22925 [bacterium]
MLPSPTSRLRAWAGPLLIVAAAGAVLAPHLWGADPIYGFDTLQEKFFWRSWAYGRLARGEWPAWCAGLVGGFPLVAEPIAQFFYPPVAVLHALTSIPRALNLTWWLHLAWAGLGMYALLRDRALGSASACVGGLAYGVAGWTVGHVPMGGLPHLATCAFGPWVLRQSLRVMRSDDGPSPREVAWAAVTIGLAVLAGHAQFLYSTLLFLALFGLGTGAWIAREPSAVRRAPRVRWRAIAGMGVALGLGIGVAGAVVVPYAEFLATSNRGAALSPEFAAFGARLTIPQLLGILAPRFFGDGSHYWGFPTQEAVTPYFGLVPLALAFSAVPRRAAREGWTLRALLLLGLLLALGHATPLYGWFREVMPLFGRARHPARWLHLSILAGAWLAALGAERIQQRLAEPRGRLWAGTGLAAVVVAAFVSGLVFTRSAGADQRFRALVTSQIEESALPPNEPLRALAPAALDQARHAAASALARACAYGLVGLGLVIACGVARQAGAAGWMLAGLTALDLVSFARPWIVPVPARRLPWPNDVLVALGPPSPAQRVATTVPGASFPFPEPFRAGHGVLSRIGQLDMHRGLLTGHLSVQGGIPTTPAAWLALALGRDAYDFNYTRVGPQPILDLLAVSRVLTAPGVRPVGDGWRRTGATEEAWVWANENALARASLVHECSTVASSAAALDWLRSSNATPRRRALVADGATCPAGIEPAAANARESVTWTVATDEHIRLDVHAARGALLRLADNAAPGWGATIDGREAPIQRVDVALRGVVVPAGTHAVEFRYRPLAQWLGLATSAAALLVLGVLASLPRRRVAGADAWVSGG